MSADLPVSGNEDQTDIPHTRRSSRTVAAANGIAADRAHGAVTPPIYLSTNFAFKEIGQVPDFDYSRSGNPSRALLADTIAKLEEGSGAVIVSSGMAAVDLVLSRLTRGALIIAPHDCYAGTHRLLSARRDRGEVSVRFVNQGNEAALDEAFQSAPALMLIETPSNPLMRIVDIRALTARAKAAGVKVAVDNTFLSPALQKPLTLGADFVIHSTTKYLNGHSDVVGGAVVAAVKSDAEKLAEWANITGVTGAPFDSYLTLRGVRSLYPRMEAQQRSAHRIAQFLMGHPKVQAVHYPGLPDHPGHAIAQSQQAGFGAMLSFELKGSLPDLRHFIGRLKLFTLAESLGGIESLVAHPATMTHASMSQSDRLNAGISDMLLRLSVGLEDEDDLVRDLDTGLSAL